MSFTPTEMASDIARRTAHATENAILEQLDDFVSRGLIEIQTTGPTLTQTRDMLGHRLEIKQSVKLVLKDKEYIVKLEKRNAELEELIKRIKKI